MAGKPTDGITRQIEQNEALLAELRPAPAPAKAAEVVATPQARDEIAPDLAAELAARRAALDAQRAQDTQQAALEARRAEATRKLATNAAAVDFKPENFKPEDAKMFAGLVAAKMKELNAGKAATQVSSRTAGELVLGDLKQVHQQQIIEAARQFRAPIVDESGMTPGDRSVVESAAAAKPATAQKVTLPKDAIPGQGKGRANVGSWAARREDEVKNGGLSRLR